jgi:hypothetical protein
MTGGTACRSHSSEHPCSGKLEATAQHMHYIRVTSIHKCQLSKLPLTTAHLVHISNENDQLGPENFIEISSTSAQEHAVQDMLERVFGQHGHLVDHYHVRVMDVVTFWTQGTQ